MWQPGNVGSEYGLRPSPVPAHASTRLLFCFFVFALVWLYSVLRSPGALLSVSTPYVLSLLKRPTEVWRGRVRGLLEEARPVVQSLCRLGMARGAHFGGSWYPLYAWHVWKPCADGFRVSIYCRAFSFLSIFRCSNGRMKLPSTFRTPLPLRHSRYPASVPRVPSLT